VIFVHEFGHFIIARLNKIDVSVFSIGFGPKILSFKDKKGTEWQFAIIPLGGFVKFSGDDNIASVKTQSNNSLGFSKNAQLTTLRS
jgi:Predicted membrane-associated Zn-dependent proteases 1